MGDPDNTSTGWSNSSDHHIVLDPLDILQELNRRKSLLLVPVIVYTVILMTIGIIGNPIAIIIYGWRWQQTTTKYFLLCLAVFDLINCLITMPTEIALMMNFYYFNNSAICKLSRFTTYTMNNASVFVLLVIAIDRFIRICKPHNQTISVRGSKITCGVAMVVGVGVSWPAIILYGRVYVPIPIPGGTVIKGVMCLVENQYNGTSYILAFMIYLWVAFCIIAIVMAVLYILIGREIIKRKRLRQERKASKTCNAKKHQHENVSAFSCNNSVPNAFSAIPVSPTSVTEDPLSGAVHANNHSTSTKGRLPKFSSLKLSKSKLRPGKTTLMLFAITVMYILSFLPFLIIGIVRLMFGDSFYPNLSRTEEVAVNIFLRSYLVNNCANPLVYGLCNSQFRKECRNLLCKKRDFHNFQT